MRLLKEIRNLLDNYHVKSGIYHYYRGEFGPAVEFLRKALDADDLASGDRRIARYYLTMTLTESAERREEKGEIEEAVREYVQAVDVSPRYPDVRLRYGTLLERTGRVDEAVEQYRKAVDINPTYLDAWVAMGFALLRAGRLDDATDAFRSARDLKVARTVEPFESGIEAVRRSDPEGAERTFHEAFRYVPELFEQRHRAGILRLKEEKYAEALEDLDAAVEMNPAYPDLFNFKGIALCEMDRIDEALEAFEHASKLNPRFLAPRLNHAFALLRAGRLKEAEDGLEAVLAEDPTEPAARAKLRELQASGRPDKRRGAPRGNVR